MTEKTKSGKKIKPSIVVVDLERYTNIKIHPFTIALDKADGSYSIQKQFWTPGGMKYPKIMFDKYEIHKLVELFYKIKDFREAFIKLYKRGGK